MEKVTIEIDSKLKDWIDYGVLNSGRSVSEVIKDAQWFSIYHAINETGRVPLGVKDKIPTVDEYLNPTS